MSSKAILAHEISHYQILSERLKEAFADVDDQTLHDTLEGPSNLPGLIQELVRSSLEDQALADALKLRLDEMRERMERLRARSESKRELACWTMTDAGIIRLQAPDFSVSISKGPVRLEILDETRVPAPFLVPQPPRVDRVALLAALKRGEFIDGAEIITGQPHLAVRVR